MAAFDLAGKHIIISGGGSGIGKAISLKLAHHGAHVHILDLTEDHYQTTLESIKQAKGSVTAYDCNVAHQKAVIGSIDSIASKHTVYGLVNNAGIAHIGNVENTTEEDIDRVYQVNIKGVYNCLHATIPHMKEHGGVVINIASVAASVGISDRFAYSMSKGAVLTMTYSIAKDYLAHGIRCNSISPARIHTPFVDNFLKKNYPDKEQEMFEKLSKTQPIGRMGQPEEVAALALFLCSEEAAFITGTDFPIDGGFIKLNS